MLNDKCNAIVLFENIKPLDIGIVVLNPFKMDHRWLHFSCSLFLRFPLCVLLCGIFSRLLIGTDTSQEPDLQFYKFIIN